MIRPGWLLACALLSTPLNAAQQRAAPPLGAPTLALPLDASAQRPDLSAAAPAGVGADAAALAAPAPAALPDGSAPAQAQPSGEEPVAAPAAPVAGAQGADEAARQSAGQAFDGGGGRGEPPDQPFFVRHYGLLRPLRPLVHAWLRPKISGLENVPKGAVVIGSNHVAFGPDVLGLSYALDRPVRYFFKRSLHDAQPLWAKLRSGRVPVWQRPIVKAFAWGLPKLFHSLGTIPVSSKDPPELVEASLETGRRTLRHDEAIAIFVDQELTRSGFIGGVRPGFARVANGVPGTPVIPVYLDGLWGHAMSRRHLPRGSYLKATLPRMRVKFGAKLPENTPLAMRQALEELSEAAMRERVAQERAPIALEFLRRARCFSNAPAAADLSRRLTYGELAAEVVAVARYVRPRLAAKNSEPSVAVMLPPSIAAAEANLAVAALGRAVVNVDYSADRDETLQMLSRARVSTILTTRAFARSQGLRARAGLQIVFVEDALSRATPASLRFTRALVRWLPASWSAALLMPKASRSLDDEAAVVFTSGSDSRQKGVVLTHLNVLAGVEMAREILPAAKADTTLAVMPFFSAFGVARGVWLPLLSGMQAAYHADFADARGVAALAEKVGPTLLFATPSMLRRYAREVPKKAFSTLRFVVAGAEKLHKAVAEEFKAAFGARPIEEYGSTETSSLIAVSVPEPALPTDPSPDPVYSETAGRNVPGTVVKAVDPETGALMPEGKTGLLVVKGANVMKGYLGEPGRSADVLQGGWYVTDDLGSIDREGRVTIKGPKARRSTIDGELVSHASSEERLRAASGDPAADFVVTSMERPDGKSKLVALYAGWRGDVSALLDAARAAGMSSAELPAAEDFHQVDRIPRLGNSKLDLMRVRAVLGRLSAAAPR